MTPNENEPVWISVKDTQHYFSIGKTRCYELINENLIESKILTQRGAARGKRIIKFSSVADYIDSLSSDITNEHFVAS